MMPRTGNSATGYALRSIPRARNAQQRLNRRISQTGNSLHLSTVAKSKGSCPSWVKIESAGWVRIQSARTALRKMQTELLAFEEKLRHYADMRITIDLDDGVKANYAKFGDLVAESKVITGGSDE